MLTFSQEIWLKILEGALIGVPVLVIGILFIRHFRAKPDALAELTKHLASCIHSISWLCWSVQHSPAAIRGNIKTYNAEMHKQLSDLMASRVQLAVQDAERYNTLAPVMAKVLALDWKVGKVVAGCLSLHPLQEAAAQKELINCHVEATELDKELLKMVSDMLQVKE
ncbi:hypothetical protein AAHN97_11075 [Chitinophaga niabensis]|uniref:hypothetical protein n=1 Tax=Chitinophaga niabensis TaxID=536979 RepID=UPI0031BAFA92